MKLFPSGDDCAIWNEGMLYALNSFEVNAWCVHNTLRALYNIPVNFTHLFLEFMGASLQMFLNARESGLIKLMWSMLKCKG